MKRKLQVAGLMLTVVVALAACSSNTKTTTTTAPPSGSTTTTASPATTAAPTTTTTKPAQVITISPATGLTNDETITIKGTGYPANQSQGITECANKGNQTTANDCNLGGIGVTKASATGTISATFKVALGPFGGNHIVCTSPPGCIVSVATEGSADPTDVATAVLKFS
jgi:maltose-binding protein MalE